MLLVSFSGINLQVVESSDHVFLLSSKDVASGYGVSESVIRSHRQNQSDELIEGKHFIIDRSYKNTPKTYWTKKGIVRLGFFIKSKQAKAFRDWAEDYIINKENDSNYVPYSLLYSKERECIELKRAMNRIIENQNLFFGDTQSHADLLDAIGYMSRAAKTFEDLAKHAIYYHNTAISFLDRIQERFKDNKAIAEQSKRLPRHQIYS